MNKTKLTDLQAAFVEHYCNTFDGKNFNASLAALRAGFSEKSAHKQASQILAKPRIQAAIKKRLDKIADKNDITLRELISGYRNISIADIIDYVSWTNEGVVWKDSSELTKEQTARIKEVQEVISPNGRRTFKIILHDRIAGLNGLAKISGKIIDKREVSGVGGKPIEIESKQKADLSKLSDEQLKQYEEIHKVLLSDDLEDDHV